MPKGTCACGDYTYEVEGNPESIVVCHCIPCRKFAGANGSVNAVVPSDKYKRLSGDLKTWIRKGDSGKEVTNGYCANCSTLMRVDAEAMPGMVIYKASTLDQGGALDGAKVVQEMYTRNRPNCFDALSDVPQKEGA